MLVLDCGLKVGACMGITGPSSLGTSGTGQEHLE